jgi:hypothetical protein
MALLTIATISRDGVDIAATDVPATVTTGDTWANTGGEFFYVNNGSGSSINVTFDIQATVDGQAVADRVVAVGAGIAKVIGPFPTGQYNDGSGLAKATCSAVTTVTVAVFKFTPVG